MVRLIMVCGLPGTGKSTVAKFIAEKIGAELLRTDVIRKELFSGKDYLEYGSENVSPEEERMVVYEEMFKHMVDLLKEGKNVILDGTFHKKEVRDKAFFMAKEVGVELEIIEIICPEELVKKGMAERIEKQEGASTAGFEIYLIYKKMFEPVKREHLVVDTGDDWKTKLAKDF
ncbi:AAA family ATPase [Nanoarchaeota archaeon]